MSHYWLWQLLWAASITKVIAVLSNLLTKRKQLQSAILTINSRSIFSSLTTLVDNIIPARSGAPNDGRLDCFVCSLCTKQRFAVESEATRVSTF